MSNGTLIVFALGWVFLLTSLLINDRMEEKRVTIKLMLATASCAFFIANAIYTFVK